MDARRRYWHIEKQQIQGWMFRGLSAIESRHLTPNVGEHYTQTDALRLCQFGRQPDHFPAPKALEMFGLLVGTTAPGGQ